MAPRNGSAARKHLDVIETKLNTRPARRKAKMASFYVSEELLLEMDLAADAVYRGNRSFLISEAVERHLTTLREIHNDGQPFRGRRPRVQRRQYRSLR